MIDILFISNNKKKYRYFNVLKQKLSLKIIVFKLSICLVPKIKDNKIQNIMNKNIQHKLKEIDLKYKNRFYKFLYKHYLNFITPFLTKWFLIKSKNVKAIALWNGQRFPESLFVDLARLLNKKTIFFEVGFFPNTTVIDPQGVNYHNSIPRNIDFYNNYPIKKEIFPKKINKRNHLIKRNLNYIQLPNQYIFVPFQTAFDTQIIYNSPWIKSMYDLFYLIEEIANKLHINFVFKEHPHERDFKYEKLHEKAKNNKFLTFANGNETEELIKNSLAVITINSTVGLEALLMHKKVIVLGNAFFSLEKITKKANTQEELEKTLKHINNFKPDIDLIDKFISYLINEYLVKGSWNNPDKEHFLAVEKRLKDIINDTYNGNFSQK